MKTLHILLLVVVLFTGSSFTNAKKKELSNNEIIASKIQHCVQPPATVGSEETQSRVLVVFSIAETGKVVVHEVGTADQNLKQSLTGQFEAIMFDNSTKTLGGMYSIWLNFKVL